MEDEKIRKALGNDSGDEAVKWFGWRAGKAPAETIAILGNDGKVHTPAAKGKAIPSPNGGVHVREGAARFWLPEKIPSGWLTVYVEDDPEPVTTREPRGYGKKTIEMLTGPYTLHLVGGGLKTPKDGLRLNTPIVIGIAVFILVLALGFFIFRSRYG